jgi:hypothetical protein
MVLLPYVARLALLASPRRLVGHFGAAAATLLFVACAGDATVPRPADSAVPLRDFESRDLVSPHDGVTLPPDRGVPAADVSADQRKPPSDLGPTPDLVPSPDTVPSFNDVPTTHEAYAAITWAAAAGHMRPCAPNTFCPDQGQIRSAAAESIVSMKYGSPTGYPAGGCFTDVPPTHPSFPAIQKLCGANIVAGTGNGQFRPNDAIKRGSAATLVCKAKYGATFSYPQTPYFSDVPATHWAFPYVQKLAATGVIVGGGGALYYPDDVMQRKWWATILHRIQSL